MSWPKQRSSEDKHADGTRDFHGPCLGTSPCPSLTCQPFDIHIPPRICHSEPTCTPQPLWRCGHERSSQPPGWCNMRRDMWGEIYTLYTHLWQTWKKCSCDRAEENRFISKLSPSTEKTSQRWSPMACWSGAGLLQHLNQSIGNGHARESLLTTMCTWLWVSTKPCHQGQVKVKLVHQPINISSAVHAQNLRRVCFNCFNPSSLRTLIL